MWANETKSIQISSCIFCLHWVFNFTLNENPTTSLCKFCNNNKNQCFSVNSTVSTCCCFFFIGWKLCLLVYITFLYLFYKNTKMFRMRANSSHCRTFFLLEIEIKSRSSDRFSFPFRCQLIQSKACSKSIFLCVDLRKVQHQPVNLA